MDHKEWVKLTEEREEAIRNGTLVVSEEEKRSGERVKAAHADWYETRPLKAKELRELVNSLEGRLPEELLAALRETSERVIRYALVSRPMGWTGEQPWMR